MYKYSVLCLLLCLSLQARAALDESDLDDTDRQCIEDLSIDKNVVLNSYDEHNFIIEGNPEMNKFYSCAWKKDGLQNDDGTINSVKLQTMVELKLKKMFPDHANYRKHVAAESIKDCTSVKGSDDGDTCAKIYNCILKRVGEISKSTKPGDF